jgi:RDD family
MSNQALSPSEPRKPVATWRKVVAAVLDFLFIFFVGGFAVGYLTGNLTDSGFELHGAPALILFAVIAIYFVVFSKFLGGTLGQRLLGVR